MRIVIAVDDIHPDAGWGLPGDAGMDYLHELNKEFGAMFTLFIPSNYHRKFPLSKYVDWVEWLKTHTYFELAAHGHYHDTSNPNSWGECEFGEIADLQVCRERLHNIRDEWNAVKHIPVGWRNPGWLCQPINTVEIGNMFRYVALHYEHNRGIKWPCVEFYGHDGIHTTEVGVHNGDMIMFQSHIFGDWNDNVWNQRNYDQIRASLAYLHETYPDSVHCTLSMCI